MKLKPYPKYKPSGVEWLGDVPEHWEVKRLKYLFSLNTKKAESRDNPIALENIESWTGRYVKTESEFDGEGIYFQRGDILFGKLRPYLAKVYMADRSGEAIGDFFVLHPLKTIIGRYASYLIRTPNYIEVIDGSTFGAKMPRVSWDFMGSLPFLLPSISEQKAITDFLDRETGKIDELISKKERLIELLKEKRTALISRAVTKGLPAEAASKAGLNPNVRLKPSGVEWLGDVPEHWEVKRLKYCSKIIMGQSPNSDEYSDEPDLTPFLQGNADFTERYPEPRIFCKTANKIAPKDSLLISVRAPVGALNEANQNYGIGRGLCAIIPGVVLFKAYYWYLLQVTREELNVLATGSTYDAVSVNEVGNMLFIIPPFPEQQSIASYLDRETGKIDALAEKVRKAIEKLKEYRTALISAAVTGKIDVRGAA